MSNAGSMTMSTNPGQSPAAKDSSAAHEIVSHEQTKDACAKVTVVQPRSANTSWMSQHLAGFAFFAGSGLLAGVSYLDPGNLEADIQLGVTAGMSLLWWTAVCCLGFGFTFQCFAGRVGIVTGKDMAHHLGVRYPKPARILLWLLMEVAIIGADIQETIGSAIAISILSGGAIPLAAGCVMVSVSAFCLLLLDRVGFRQLEMLFAVLILVEGVCMGINFVHADIPSDMVARGIFIPQLTSATLPSAVAALGALVMPYNIFWQSWVVNARPRDKRQVVKPAPAPGDVDTSVLEGQGRGLETATSPPEHCKTRLLHYFRLETILVLVLAFVINTFVICVFAKGFYPLDDEDEVGLETAGEHLAERYGTMFQTVWALGLLASGQVSTIGLTHAGQQIMMGMLNLEVSAGLRMTATRLVALLPTVTLAVVFEASRTFNRAAQALNIVQSMMLPFALVPVLHLCADHKLLGSKFASRPWLTAFGAAVATVVVAVNGYLLVDFQRTVLLPAVDGGHHAAVTTAFVVVCILYFSTVTYFAVGPEHWPAVLCRCRAGVKLVMKRLYTSKRPDFESMVEVHI